MTELEKQKVITLRESGKSYNDISKELNISRNTIISFLRRNQEVEVFNVCKNCGCSFIPRDGNRIKLFCSDKCRLSWWNKNKEIMNTNKETYICETCKKPFQAYSTRNKKFCCRECYLNYKGGNNGTN